MTYAYPWIPRVHAQRTKTGFSAHALDNDESAQPPDAFPLLEGGIWARAMFSDHDRAYDTLSHDSHIRRDV